MTVTDAVVDLTTAASGTISLPHPTPVGAPAAAVEAPDSTSTPVVDGRMAHLLRLSLDLQLDAMLMNLGAAAASSASASASGAGVTTALPWRRWLDEDVVATRELTAAVMATDGAVPATLGLPGTSHADASRVAEDLQAHYESMARLLADLAGRRPAGASGSWELQVSRALARCRGRIEEIRRYRELLAAALEPAPDFLPGQMLG